jgi:hypothetical protein
MISGDSRPGTSMMKQWLRRRAVRRPVSRATTAAISSSVWRLPFISASAWPSRTRHTALAAESWLCATSTRSKPPISMAALMAALSIFARGPTRIGTASFIFAASTALSNDTASHGCAIAVLAGGWRCASSTRRRNLACSWPREATSASRSSIGRLLLDTFLPSALLRAVLKQSLDAA